jgi:hypothetical protein
VHPAFIEGDMVDAIVHGRPDPDKARAKLQAQIPIGPPWPAAGGGRQRNLACCRRPLPSQPDRKCWWTAA